MWEGLLKTNPQNTKGGVVYRNLAKTYPESFSRTLCAKLNSDARTYFYTMFP